MNQPIGESAVIVIDLQKCFLPGGNLPTTNSRNTKNNKNNNKMITHLGTDTNKFIKELKPNNLFISLDWHPEDHISFIKPELIKMGKKSMVDPEINHSAPGKPFLTSIQAYKKEDIKPRVWHKDDKLNHTRQTLWTPHCIQNNSQAMVDESLKIQELINFNPKYVLKGFTPNVDSYSVVADALGNPTPYIYEGKDLTQFKHDDNVKTTFLTTLQNSNINIVYLTGIARNVCVFWSAMDLLEFWILPAYFGIGDGNKKIIKLIFVYDLTRPVVSGLFDKDLDISKESINNKIEELINKYKEVNNSTNKEDTQSIISKIFQIFDSSDIITLNGGSIKHKNYNYNKTKKTRKYKFRKIHNNKSRKTRKTKSKKY